MKRGNPLPNTLIEIWQTNAAGRYRHTLDDFPAPLDPNFTGLGRIVTDEDGKYRFPDGENRAHIRGIITRNCVAAGAHSFSRFFGPSFVSRFITQMYFEGDPMLEVDPVFLSVPDKAKHRLLAEFDIGLTEERFALGYRFDLVLRGPDATPVQE